MFALIAAFLRELASVAPLFTSNQDIARIANGAATLIERGESAASKLEALTTTIKARRESGQAFTADEVNTLIGQIEELHERIQNTPLE